VTTCRSEAEVIAAGLAAGDAMPPLDQDTADDIAVILAARNQAADEAA
jgi:hypothetical protein